MASYCFRYDNNTGFDFSAKATTFKQKMWFFHLQSAAHKHTR